MSLFTTFRLFGSKFARSENIRTDRQCSEDDHKLGYPDHPQVLPHRNQVSPATIKPRLKREKDTKQAEKHHRKNTDDVHHIWKHGKPYFTE